MTGQLENKVVLVTGGGSGIGSATATAVADAGAKVVIADVDVAGGEATVQTIRKKGREAHFVKTDVAQAVVWLCSDAASFVTGHTMLIDGGYTAQ